MGQFFLALGFCVVAVSGARAQDIPSPLSGYSTFAQMEASLQELASSDWAGLSSLGETRGKRNIWLLSVAADRNQTRPAIVVLGNVQGSHVLGRELALRMAQKVVRQAESDPATAEWLGRFTLYFIPNPTPDATEKNFRFPVREHDGNLTATDDDRDFDFGEDPPRDLNQDGWITMMRVSDPFGTHRAHPSDPRVLIPVDAKKREVGQYRLLPESLDADQDEKFGEDGSDGVDFNRNFTFEYQYFSKSAGPHQVSEQETRAVADFLFDNPNIACVFCFSPEDNLFHPWKGSQQTDSARIKTKVLTEDQRILDCLSNSFRKLHGGKGAPEPSKGEGSFSEWSYFHFGRWTFASPGWWIPPSQAKPAKSDEEKAAVEEDAKPSSDQAVTSGDDSSETQPPSDESSADEDKPAGTSSPETAEPEAGETGDAKKEESSPEEAAKPAACEQTNSTRLEMGDQRGAQELNALVWFKNQGVSGFIEWQPFDHPNFPDKQVEIGGFKPLMMLNPPENLIEPLVQPHVDFLKVLTDSWPSLEIRDVQAARLGPGLFDIRCSVVNTGPIPTMPLMGDVNDQWYPIQVQLRGATGARWIEGSPRQSVGRLKERGGSKELRWVFLMPTTQDSEGTSDTSGELLMDSAEGGPGFSVEAYAPTLHRVQFDIDAIETTPEKAN